MQSTFVKDVRKLREKEMQQYEDKGYCLIKIISNLSEWE